ncbi:GNAT family N-acetyltransferase [Parasphingorhabdus sp.]|uniref:GNAT family N-acetyltransferase n=1 Tax=Parasphingorhabdus sp. TaxID=2709688 RepID=UPI003265E949
MTKESIKLTPYRAGSLEEVLELTVRAWTPVFPKMEKEIPSYVYKAFYPSGWQARQLADVEAMCSDGETEIWLALKGGEIAGYLGLRSHPEDSMGEIYIIAVDPHYQRQGVGAALMDFALSWMKQKGLAMAMVETGGDEGHSPSRATYEHAGFERYPVARYFRKV